MKLNGWQRIGVVLSIVWAICVALYQRNLEIQGAEQFVSIAYGACMSVEGAKTDGNLKRCGDELGENLRIHMAPNWLNIGVVALLPVVLAWVSFYALLRVLRWIRAGF